MRHLITTDDLSVKEIENLFSDAESYLSAPPPKLLQNRLIITLFLKTQPELAVVLKLQQKNLVQMLFTWM